MSKVQVLQIIAGFAVEGPLGGIERFGIELARALKDYPIEPIVCGMWRFHTSYEIRWEETLTTEGVEAFSVADWDEAHPYRSFLKTLLGALQRLHGRKIDIVHSHCPFGDIMAILLAPFLRFPALIRTVHNEREWPKRPLRRALLTNLLYPLVFKWEIGVSERVRVNLENRPLARLLRKKSLCVYNAVNLKRFDRINRNNRDDYRQELGIPIEVPLIISIGRLTAQKGYEVLLKAIPLVLSEIPSARFMIVGTGELEQQLKHMTNKLGITQTVTFTGPRPDVEKLLASADLFVSSSLWEGLPTVILESMAARVPVVATEVSGTVELVESGKTGLLVPPGDHIALAQAIIKMVREKGQASVMANSAFNKVQMFSIEKIAEHYAEIYTLCVKHRSKD